MTFFGIALVFIGAVVTLLSIKKCKHNGFYGDTFWLFPLGVYVWGDGIVLGAFWFFSGFLFLILDMSLIWILRYILLFWLIRSGYEVMYWFISQFVDQEYCPPIGKNVSWLEPNQVKILYQVAHTCAMVVLSFLLLYSFFV